MASNLKVFVLLFSCLVAVIGAAHVQVLTDSTFDDVIGDNEHVLVEFFAPWCGHCKALAPEYERAASILAAEGSKIILASVDCTVEHDLARRFDIKGFPTLKFFKSEKPMEYNGERKADAIVSWLKKKTEPAVTTLTTKEAVDAFIASHEAVVLGFFAKGSEVQKAFTSASGNPQVEDISFGEITDAALTAQLEGQANTIKIVRNFDEPVTLESKISANSITEFVLANALPYIMDAPKGWSHFMERKLPVVLIFADTDAPEWKDVVAWFSPVAKKYKEQMSFGSVGKQFHGRISQMGASGEKFPTAIITELASGKNYPFDESKEFNAENVEAHIKGVLSGSLSPHFRTEAAPATQEGPVTVVVGSTFKELVLDSKKSVFVEFYAPWCGHCKQLAPTIDELGKHYADSKDVVIAKIDASSNDNPSVVIKGFPTMYLFKAGAKDQPIEYQGGRDLESFISWIDNETDAKAHDEL